MYKVLLFDFDGTIADTFENFIEIVGKLSVTYNLPVLSRKELEALRSEDARSIIKRLNIPLYKIPLLARDMKKLQQENITGMKAFEGLPDVLRSLKNRKYILGIVTSNGKENVELFLKKNNMDFFDYIHTDSSIFGKDRVLNSFLKQHTLTKDDVLYIGDEIRDIVACKKAGIKIAAVTWGFTTKEGLKKHNPDFLIEHPEKLLQVSDT